MTFIPHVLEPLILIVKNHKGEYKSLIGNSELYRNLFAEWFDKSEMRLEDLDEKEKVILKEESKTYCMSDRLKWCKAVKFYESF